MFARPFARLMLCGLLLSINACAYLKNTLVQAEYSRLQSANPSMVNLKHMIDRDTYFVYGELIDPEGTYTDKSLVIAAFSSRYQQHELVDSMHGVLSNTHFGLNLPPGEYRLVVFADLDANLSYQSDEVIGEYLLTLRPTAGDAKVRGDVDISLGIPGNLEWSVEIAVKSSQLARQSLFYPAGSLRHLEDPLFEPEMATLGMYHPAAFLENARTMFYALDEDVSYKIPVIFVHGINGSTRDFAEVVNRLDKTRFKSWFFYYPSGGDLDQMARFFHNIFLSGEVASVDEHVPIIVIAHSMGGLIVREALNLLEQRKNTIHFISLATPFGGHPAAADGEKYGLMVLPSWRGLNPRGRFVGELFRKSLPSTVTHHLAYAYGDPDNVKFGENSDGVVPLSSQLFPAAQQQADSQIGFNTSHTGILSDEEAIDHVVARLGKIQLGYPEDHRRYLLQGGFEVIEADGYTARQVHVLRYFGAYIRALVEEIILPLNQYQKDFLAAVRGETASVDYVDKSWRKFVTGFPAWRTMIPKAP